MQKTDFRSLKAHERRPHEISNGNTPVRRSQLRSSATGLLLTFLGLLSITASAQEQTKPNAATNLQKLSHLSDIEQHKANSEANAFRLPDAINTSTDEDEGGEVTGATGALPLSVEEEAQQRKHTKRVKKVLLNKIGLARLNDERVKKGLKPLQAGRDVQVAPLGKDVLTEDVAASGSLSETSAEMDPAASAELLAAAGSISEVDNSKLKYFPPIGNQGSVGSCVHWADIYYNMTHEVAMQRDWDAKTGGDFYRFAPMFTYNFTVQGTNTGTSFNSGFTMALKAGCVRKSEKPNSGSFRPWLHDNPDAYRQAIEARVSGLLGFSNIDRATGLQTLKDHLANGHVATFKTYIDSWQYKTVGNDPSTSDDDAYAGKKIAYNMSGTSGTHEMTVCGYSDSIWCDLNANGSVDNGEKGALLVANSWGTGYKNGGFCWVAYSALNSDIFRDKAAVAVSVGAAPRIPKVVARLTINHSARNQLYIRLGIGDVGATAPATSWTPSIVNMQGGNYAFSGVAPTQEDMSFYLDFTDIAPSMGMRKRWFVMGYDSTGVGDLTIKSFELFYVNGGTDQLVGTAANTPLVLSGAYGGTWIDWTMGDTPQYSVTLNKQGGSGGSNAVNAILGSAMPSAVAPTRTGYMFDGYFGSTNGEGTQYYSSSMNSMCDWNISSNSTLYARWVATYETWSGGAAFGGDSNGDGISDGLAWLLGATDKNSQVSQNMPKANQDSGGGLSFNFTCRRSNYRFGKSLKVQTSSDLGVSDAWNSQEAEVPDTSGTHNGIQFTVSPHSNPELINVQATIPPGPKGREFSRLSASP